MSGGTGKLKKTFEAHHTEEYKARQKQNRIDKLDRSYDYKFVKTTLYKSYLDLLEQFILSTGKFDPEMRCTFRPEIIEMLTESCSNCCFAYSHIKDKEEKKKYFRRGIEEIRKLEVKIRVFVDIRLITRDQFILLAEKALSVLDNLKRLEEYIS